MDAGSGPAASVASRLVAWHLASFRPLIFEAISWCNYLLLRHQPRAKAAQTWNPVAKRRTATARAASIRHLPLLCWAYASYFHQQRLAFISLLFGEPGTQAGTCSPCLAQLGGHRRLQQPSPSMSRAQRTSQLLTAACHQLQQWRGAKAVSTKLAVELLQVRGRSRRAVQVCTGLRLGRMCQWRR